MVQDRRSSSLGQWTGSVKWISRVGISTAPVGPDAIIAVEAAIVVALLHQPGVVAGSAGNALARLVDVDDVFIDAVDRIYRDEDLVQAGRVMPNSSGRRIRSASV